MTEYTLTIEPHDDAFLRSSNKSNLVTLKQLRGETSIWYNPSPFDVKQTAWQEPDVFLARPPVELPTGAAKLVDELFRSVSSLPIAMRETGE